MVKVCAAFSFFRYGLISSGASDRPRNTTTAAYIDSTLVTLTSLPIAPPM